MRAVSPTEPVVPRSSSVARRSPTPSPVRARSCSTSRRPASTAPTCCSDRASTRRRRGPPTSSAWSAAAPSPRSGTASSGWAVGDQACALLSAGAYATQVAVPAGQLMPVPDGVDLVAAAALPEVACTVWSNVFMIAGAAARRDAARARRRRRHRHASRSSWRPSSGRGCSRPPAPPRSATSAAALGAEVAIDYRDEDFVEVVQASAPTAPARTSSSTTWARRTSSATSPRWRPRAGSSIIGMQGGTRAELDIDALLRKRGAIIATTLRARPAEEKAAICASVVEHVWPLVADGKVQPIVDTHAAARRRAPRARADGVRRRTPGRSCSSRAEARWLPWTHERRRSRATAPRTAARTASRRTASAGPDRRPGRAAGRRRPGVRAGGGAGRGRRPEARAHRPGRAARQGDADRQHDPAAARGGEVRAARRGEPQPAQGDPPGLDQASSRPGSRRSWSRSWSGCRCRSPTTRPRRRASCGSPRPSSSAGSRASSTASRPRSTPSRWRRGRSSSRCAAGCRRDRAAAGGAAQDRPAAAPAGRLRRDVPLAALASGVRRLTPRTTTRPSSPTSTSATPGAAARDSDCGSLVVDRRERRGLGRRRRSAARPSPSSSLDLGDHRCRCRAGCRCCRRRSRGRRSPLTKNMYVVLDLRARRRLQSGAVCGRSCTCTVSVVDLALVDRVDGRPSGGRWRRARPSARRCLVTSVTVPVKTAIAALRAVRDGDRRAAAPRRLGGAPAAAATHHAAPPSAPSEGRSAGGASTGASQQITGRRRQPAPERRRPRRCSGATWSAAASTRRVRVRPWRTTCRPTPASAGRWACPRRRSRPPRRRRGRSQTRASVGRLGDPGGADLEQRRRPTRSSVGAVTDRRRDQRRRTSCRVELPRAGPAP